MATTPNKKPKESIGCSIYNLPFHDKQNCPRRDDQNFVPDLNAYSLPELQLMESDPPNQQQQQYQIVETIKAIETMYIEVQEEVTILATTAENSSSGTSTEVGYESVVAEFFKNSSTASKQQGTQ